MTTSEKNLRFWAYLLVIGGLVFLAGNLGWLAWVASWLWAAAFLAGGAAFLYHYRAVPQHWWALIPGAALTAIGVTILAPDAGGPLFLGILGAGFAGVYLSDRQRWWAIIPSGVLVTLALVAWVDQGIPRLDTGWLFFLGLAATFGTLFVLPEGRGRQRWAVYPAVGALAFALLSVLTGAVSGVVVPLLLVAAGIYLIWRQGQGGDRRSPARPRKAA